MTQGKSHRSSKIIPKKKQSYETNAARVIENPLVQPSTRVLHAARVSAETKLVRKQGRPSTISEIQVRHNFTEEAAQRFLRSVTRALQKQKKPVQKKEGLKIAQDSTPNVRLNPESSISAAKEVHLAAVLKDIRRNFEKEIRNKGEQTSVKEGFVYLVTHPSFEGWVKAGMTIDYELRLASYNVADPLSRFELLSAKWVKDRREAEKLLLKKLEKAAQEMRGEWALIGTTEAITLFEEL